MGGEREHAAIGAIVLNLACSMPYQAPKVCWTEINTHIFFSVHSIQVLTEKYVNNRTRVFHCVIVSQLLFISLGYAIFFLLLLLGVTHKKTSIAICGLNRSIAQSSTKSKDTERMWMRVRVREGGNQSNKHTMKTTSEWTENLFNLNDRANHTLFD